MVFAGREREDALQMVPCGTVSGRSERVNEQVQEIRLASELPLRCTGDRGAPGAS